MQPFDEIIGSAKGQLPDAFAFGGGLPFSELVVPVERYEEFVEVLFPTGGEDVRGLDAACEELGFEAIAFYVSFHRPTPQGQWGLFYFGSRMRQLAEKIRSQLLPTAPELALTLAFDIVREHEVFHFCFDVCALHQELTLGKALYNQYHDNTYSRVLCTAECYEEALANRACADARYGPSDAEPLQLKDFIWRMCKSSPPGCCDFDQPVDMLRAGLGGQLLQCTSTAGSLEAPVQWVDDAGPVDRRLCNEYVLVTPSHLDAAEQRIKIGSQIWDFHKYDPDPWPSKPHGHDREDDSKLNLSDGYLYDPRTRQAKGKENGKVLLDVRKRLERIWPDVALPPLAEDVKAMVAPDGRWS